MQHIDQEFKTKELDSPLDKNIKKLDCLNDLHKSLVMNKIN